MNARLKVGTIIFQSKLEMIDNNFCFIRKKRILFFLIPLLSLFMHFHVFKLDLIGYHVWRQTQTQSNVENFYNEDFNILNPRINSRGDGNGICTSLPASGSQ